MGLFGLFNKGPKRRSGGHLKPGQKLDYRQPAVVFAPKKQEFKKRSGISLQRSNVNWKPIVAAIVGIGLIILIGVGISQLFNSKNLQVKQFKLLGNRTINDAQVMEALDKYRSKNIISINSEQVEADLKNEFNIFDSVTVTKYYPDILSIRISEREPKLVVIGLSGAFLVDASGQVLSQIFLDPVVIPGEKLNIARGFGDPNSQYLQDIYLNEFKVKNQILDLPQDQQAVVIARDFKYETIDTNARLNRLKQSQSEYQQELLTIWEKINQAVDVSVYSNYPRIDAMDATVYSSAIKIDLERFDLTSDLENLFLARKIQINRVVWEGEMLVRIVTVDNKELIFSTDRKVSEQFEDYLLVFNQLQKEGRSYCQIDLSATKIAVRPCK